MSTRGLRKAQPVQRGEREVVVDFHDLDALIQARKLAKNSVARAIADDDELWGAVALYVNGNPDIFEEQPALARRITSLLRRAPAVVPWFGTFYRGEPELPPEDSASAGRGFSSWTSNRSVAEGFARDYLGHGVVRERKGPVKGVSIESIVEERMRVRPGEVHYAPPQAEWLLLDQRGKVRVAKLAKQGAASYLEVDGKYPKAGAQVAGLRVASKVPNMSSIGASLYDYEVLPGIREVPFSAFGGREQIGENERIRRLSEEIRGNGWVAPLIVVEDRSGPYILEGFHRFDALQLLGKDSFPALVVVDLEGADGEDGELHKASAYYYHITDPEDLPSIAQRGLLPRSPSWRGEQDAWPDGGAERRVYFSSNPEGLYMFDPTYDSSGVVLRVPGGVLQSLGIRHEVSSDYYVRRRVPPQHIEYQEAPGQWRPLSELGKGLRKGGLHLPLQWLGVNWQAWDDIDRMAAAAQVERALDIAVTVKPNGLIVRDEDGQVIGRLKTVRGGVVALLRKPARAVLPEVPDDGPVNFNVDPETEAFYYAAQAVMRKGQEPEPQEAPEGEEAYWAELRRLREERERRRAEREANPDWFQLPDGSWWAPEFRSWYEPDPKRQGSARVKESAIERAARLMLGLAGPMGSPEGAWGGPTYAPSGLKRRFDRVLRRIAPGLGYYVVETPHGEGVSTYAPATKGPTKQLKAKLRGSEAEGEPTGMDKWTSGKVAVERAAIKEVVGKGEGMVEVRLRKGAPLSLAGEEARAFLAWWRGEPAPAESVRRGLADLGKLAPADFIRTAELHDLLRWGPEVLAAGGWAELEPAPDELVVKLYEAAGELYGAYRLLAAPGAELRKYGEDYSVPMDPEVERALLELRPGQFGEAFRVSEHPALNRLRPFVEYRGEQLRAERRKVDQLDQVWAFWLEGAVRKQTEGAEAPQPKFKMPRINTKDPAYMTASEINRELEKLREVDSELNRAMIDAGRGYELPTEWRLKDDPLSRALQAVADRQRALRYEVQVRVGPGYYTIPHGAKRGPRKRPDAEKLLKARPVRVPFNRGHTEFRAYGLPVKQDGWTSVEMDIPLEYDEVDGGRVRAPYRMRVPVELRGGHVVAVKPVPDLRALAEEVDARLILDIQWPTANEVERALRRLRQAAPAMGKARAPESAVGFLVDQHQRARRRLEAIVRRLAQRGQVNIKVEDLGRYTIEELEELIAAAEGVGRMLSVGLSARARWRKVLAGVLLGPKHPPAWLEKAAGKWSRKGGAWHLGAGPYDVYVKDGGERWEWWVDREGERVDSGTYRKRSGHPLKAMRAAAQALADHRKAREAAKLHKAEDRPDEAMIAFMLPEVVAGQVALDPAGVIEGARVLPPEELHLTLVYLGKAEAAEAVTELPAALEAWARGREPLVGKLTGTGTFEQPDGGLVFYASFDSPALPAFREDLAALVAEHGLGSDKHGFTPHVTLAYLPKGAALPDYKPPEPDIVFDRLTLKIGAQRQDYPLAGSAEQEA